MGTVSASSGGCGVVLLLNVVNMKGRLRSMDMVPILCDFVRTKGSLGLLWQASVGPMVSVQMSLTGWILGLDFGDWVCGTMVTARWEVTVALAA